MPKRILNPGAAATTSANENRWRRSSPLQEKNTAQEQIPNTRNAKAFAFSWPQLD
jgi:hypothetical protein